MVQTDLGLRKVDKTATRQMVREYFRLYRYRKRLLDMVMEPHPEKRNPLRGYANAMEPDLIRAPGFESSMPKGIGHDIEDDPKDRERRWFVREVQYAVMCLPEYQQAIITKCYMQHDERPLDVEVWTELCSEGHPYGESFYYEQKGTAIMTLADAWRIVQFRQTEV